MVYNIIDDAGVKKWLYEHLLYHFEYLFDKNNKHANEIYPLLKKPKMYEGFMYMYFQSLEDSGFSFRLNEDINKEYPELFINELMRQYNDSIEPAYSFFSSTTKQDTIDKIMSISEQLYLANKSKLCILLRIIADEFRKSKYEYFQDFCKHLERERIYHLHSFSKNPVNKFLFQLEVDDMNNFPNHEKAFRILQSIKGPIQFDANDLLCGLFETFAHITGNERELHDKEDCYNTSEVPSPNKFYNRLINDLVKEIVLQSIDSKCWDWNSNRNYVSMKDIHYIGATDVTAERLYYNNDPSNLLSKLISKTNDYSFTNKWLWKLGIANKIEVTPAAEGIGFFIYLTSKRARATTRRLLADYGFGISHLIVNLLLIDAYKPTPSNNISKYDSYTCPTLIIEEPETHLHPSFQSKLADIYYDAYKSYGIRLIIETHSEYLLRKSQVIVAKLNFESNEQADEQSPFRVYYFPKIGKPYSLGYRKDGCFVNSFGKGFYDESSSLTFELL